MSKGNMLLGHARGKVGDLVFSRVNGQQVTRARATEVKNPQTESQMVQRIILNTIIQAYSRMASICDHSFEGVPTGQKSMSRFMSLNLSKIRSAVSTFVSETGSFAGCYAFSPKGLNLFTPNEYVISSGSLPEVSLASVAPLTGANIVIVSEGAVPTYGEIISSLGLQRGDQLTFIGQELYTDGRAAFKFARVILDPRNDDGSQAELTEPFIADGAVNLPNPRNEGSDLQLSSAANSLTFDLGESSMFGAAVIVSRQKADGTWLRSNAAIMLAGSIPYTQVGAFDMAEALEYTMSGGIDLESERYLNNAIRGQKIIAAPAPTPARPTLSALTAGGTDMTSPERTFSSLTSFVMSYSGSNLEDSWLVGSTPNLNVGDALAVSGIAANAKYKCTGNTGTTSEFAVSGTAKRLYLVKDDVIVRKLAQYEEGAD